MSEQTLFRDPEVFEADYLPEVFSHREGQIRFLSNCIRPALGKQAPLNVMITGSTATGKTSSIRVLFSQLSEYPSVVPVHINCHISRTPLKIFSEIHLAVVGHRPPETGIPLTAIYDKVFGRLSKTGKTLLVILDESSSLRSDDMNSVFYDLLRAHEVYGTRTCLWSVSISEPRLQPSVSSVFHPARLEYPRYTRKELIEILAIRAAAGFYPSVMPESVLHQIADHAFSSDLRTGIDLMKQCALHAESSSSRKILQQHLDSCIPSSSLMLEIDSGISSGDLYERYKKKTGISYATFYRELKTLEKAGKIELRPGKKGKGNTTIVTKVI